MHDIEDFEQELLGELQGPTPVDRVILQHEVKLLRCKCVLAVLPVAQIVLSASNPLPITDSSGRVIGFASARVNGEYVVADLAIDYATPERLDIELKTRKLYASPRMLVDDTGYSIYGVVITDNQPSDPHIAPLGEPVL